MKYIITAAIVVTLVGCIGRCQGGDCEASHTGSRPDFPLPLLGIPEVEDYVVTTTTTQN